MEKAADFLTVILSIAYLICLNSKRNNFFNCGEVKLTPYDQISFILSESCSIHDKPPVFTAYKT